MMFYDSSEELLRIYLAQYCFQYSEFRGQYLNNGILTEGRRFYGEGGFGHSLRSIQIFKFLYDGQKSTKGGEIGIDQNFVYVAYERSTGDL